MVRLLAEQSVHALEQAGFLSAIDATTVPARKPCVDLEHGLQDCGRIVVVDTPCSYGRGP